MATILIPYLPSKFTANYEWATEALGVPDNEQYISLWTHPAISINATYDLLEGFESVRHSIRAALFSDPEIRFEIPIRYEGVAVDDDVGATTIVLDLDLAKDWAVVGLRVYVEQDDDEQGVAATITAVDTGDSEITVTWDDDPPSVFPQGTTRVFPLVLVQPTTPSTVGRYRVVEAGQWVVSGKVQTFYDQGLYLTADEWKGDPLWTRPALQGADQIADGFDGNVDISGSSLMEARSLCQQSRIRRELSFSAGTDLEEWLWFKEILWGVRGKQGVFWRPTFRADLEIHTQPVSLTVSLIIRNDPNYLPWFESGFFSSLVVTRANGTAQVIEIAAVDDPDDGTLVLEVNGALGPYDPAGSSIAQISFLERTCLAEDIVTVTHAQGELLIDVATLVGPW